MSIHLRWLQRFVMVALLAAGVSLAAVEVGGEGELLDRPANFSVRAARSALLAVGRAGKRLVAVGESGIILLSDDNGISWRQAKVPTSVALTSVYFISASVGWVTGHGAVVLHTRDGGETWERQFDGREAAQLEVDAAKAKVGMNSSAASKALADAERQLKDGADKPLLDVYFSDEKNGLVVGAYGLVFATRDGGKTWRSLKENLDNPKGNHLYGIRAVGVQMYITGEQGALYRSGDGGNTFSAIKSPYVGTFFGALATPGGELVVFGLRGNAYRSADEGVTWQKVDTGLPVTLMGGTRLADGTVILIDEAGRVLQSHDLGKSFKALPVPEPSPFTGVVQAADGGLVLSGARGMTRLRPSTNIAEHKE